ncbi:MAG TPA: sugar transferase [Acidobacteriaceae bacterium]|nr:sugar transferase [Acidobacteriaceae bacterium]
MVKRLVDIVASFALLIAASPLLAFAALAILLTSRGPVLFRQIRMGRGFRPFEIFKLRTMAHAEAGLAYTLGPDPRITPIGKFLRRSKIDELPQLWNVLWGEMSLVGPRPVLPELTEEFHEYYAFLLRVRPGLTDPASLKYSQESLLLAQASDPMRFFKNVVTPDKLRISFEYLGHANLWTDLATIAMTLGVCCFPLLSRVYGELPSAGQEGIRPEPARADAAVYANQARMSAPMDGSIFAHDLAYLEAAVEEASQWRRPPWIPQQEADFRLRSASSAKNESASLL